MFKGHYQAVSNASVVLLCLCLCLMLAACNSDTPALGEERLSADEATITASMIDAIKAVTLQRHPEGPRKRFNQLKSLGCFDAQFQVTSDIPASLQHGIFASAQHYPARVRFANATQNDDTEKDFRGMSIKLSGVQGPSLWGERGQQDFLLNSYPALFAADPGDFLAFIEAQRDNSLWRYFINPAHWYSLPVIFKGRSRIDNPFAIRYWSTTPYRLGSDTRQAVKYSAAPCTPELVASAAPQEAHFLTAVMQQQLTQGPVCFSFMVQVQTDPAAMPIEDASVIWPEDISPFVEVARIIIDNQAFTAADNRQSCETISFNPWQSLPDHQPLGGINRVRKAVYSEIAPFRNAAD